MQLPTKQNINNYLFLVFLLSYPLGSYFFPIPTSIITLSAFRLGLAAFFVYQLATRQWFFPSGNISRALIFLMIFFVAYGILTLRWVPHTTYAIKEIFFLCIGTATIYQAFFYFKHLSNHHLAIKVFFLSLALVLSIGVWEFLSMKHLPSDFTSGLNALMSYHVNSLMPAVTFGNPNNLAVFLTFTIVILRTLSWSNTQYKQWSFFFFLCSFFVLLLTKSKICIGATVLFLSFEFGFKIFTHKDFFKTSIRPGLKWVAIFIASFAIIIMSSISIKEYFSSDEHHKEKESEILTQLHKNEPIGDKEPVLSSGAIRKNLLLNSIDFFIQSKGLGNGAGSFRYMIENHQGRYPTGTIVNTHSWIGKLLSSYGIPVTLLFVLWLGWCLIVILKAIKKFQFHEHHLHWLILAGGILITYPLVSNAPSSFINQTVNYLMLATLAIACDQILKKSKQTEEKA